MHIAYGNTTLRKRPRAALEKIWTPLAADTDIKRQRRLNVRKRGGIENNPAESAPVRVQSRRHSSNAQKLRLICEYEQMCLDFFWMSVDDVQDRFYSANPSVPVNILKNWLTARDIILIDAQHSSPLKSSKFLCI